MQMPWNVCCESACVTTNLDRISQELTDVAFANVLTVLCLFLLDCCWSTKSHQQLQINRRLFAPTLT